jgi:hypothetical protein
LATCAPLNLTGYTQNTANYIPVLEKSPTGKKPAA